MPRLNWAMLCDNPIVDSITNNISLIHIVERVGVTELPVLYGFPTKLVILWQKLDPSNPEIEEFRYRLMIEYPTEPEEPSPREHTHQLEVVRLRTLTALLNIPLKEAGEMVIRVELYEDDNWREVARVPLEVELTAP